MPRLIDAEKLEEYKASGVSELTEWQQGWNDALDFVINEVPTVDAEPVVRCKDCKWFDPNGYYGANCAKWSELFIYYEERLPIDENGYCHMGERYE